MRKVLAFIGWMCFVTTGNKLHAQMFFTGTEYGAGLGAAHYFGDLNDNYGLNFARPAATVFTRIHINPFMAAKFSASYARVGYDDKLSTNPYNKRRNLSFQSDVFEVAMQAEFNFWRFTTGQENARFAPYITGGIGAFYYNPYTQLNGSRYNLKDIGTEGQFVGYAGRIYNNFSVCFPLGVGIKYWVVPGVNIGVEITDRLTLTDYLDDVSTTYVDRNLFDSDPSNPSTAYILQDRSLELGGEPLGRPGKQRGNSATKDQYMMVMFNISFQFKTYRCPSWLKGGYYMY